MRHCPEIRLQLTKQIAVHAMHVVMPAPSPDARMQTRLKLQPVDRPGGRLEAGMGTEGQGQG